MTILRVSKSKTPEEDMETKSDGCNVSIECLSKMTSPFYELPHRKTSAEIINEARLAIRGMCAKQIFSVLYYFD